MKTSVLALSLLLAIPFVASAAQGLSYNYVGSDYVRTKADQNAKGWALKGSFAFQPNWSVFGDYNKQKFRNIDLKQQQWRLGLGYNYSIADHSDLLARIAYKRINLSGSNPNSNGINPEVGLNTAFGDHVLVYTLAGYERFFKKDGVKRDSQVYGLLGGQVNFNGHWALNGEMKLGKQGAKEWSIGPRFTW
ncbi:Ax21 family protein [Xylella fastidiosa]|uniref:OmpO family porin n=1 Tax=Xylella fastidiosa TaxID=2371 RepID=UPI000FFF283A|nr:Ax21 family protein [Xylella fastidiosa]RWA38007.1 Ax21 family protein [Xylella fastidiosa subsp. multiplex]